MPVRHIVMKDETIMALKIFAAKNRVSYSQAIQLLIERYGKDKDNMGGENGK